MSALLPFACVLLGLPWLAGAGVVLEVELGQDAHLPCSYVPEQHKPLVPVCWGKGTCPLSGCSGLVLSMDHSGVQQWTDRRYQLKGHLHQGDVSLTIERAALNDSGDYCCRVQFPGPWNDKKVTVKLTVRPAEAIPTTTQSRSFTDTLPWGSSTEGHDPETGTPEQPWSRNGSQAVTVASEPLDTSSAPRTGSTHRTGVYIGAAVSVGLLLLASVASLLCYSHWKEKLHNSRLITLTEDPVTGLTNRAAVGENIYIIEENVYEMEDENYCSVIPRSLA